MPPDVRRLTLLRLVVTLVCCGCTAEELPPALPVAAPFPAPKPKLSDSVLTATLLPVAAGTVDVPIESIRVDQPFAVTVTATVDSQTQTPELRGMVSCIVTKNGQRVIVQQALWDGKRTAGNQYAATVTLKCPISRPNTSLMLDVQGKILAEVPFVVKVKWTPLSRPKNLFY